MITNTGVNLLDPGKTPADNIQFLIFLAAIIEAVDEYADLLRLSVASAGNDHRLGANEAPPAIISIFLGAELEAVVDSIKNDTFFEKIKTTKMNIGTTVIPHFTKDNTDRNRTSPFAFTGNKFEFRSLGSSLSVSGPNVVLNTAVAEVLSRFYEKLKDVPEADIESKVHDIVKESITAHERVIFNGNGYTDEWVKEAEKRGLYNLKSTPDALPSFIAEKNKKLFEKHNIFTESEIESRYEILLENYSKTIHIESLTLKDMVLSEFLPSVGDYTDQLVASVSAKKALDSKIGSKADMKLIELLSESYDKIFDLAEKLSADTDKAEGIDDSLTQAKFYHETIISDMEELRKEADAIEGYLPDGVLPYPKYEDILFYI
jgi:glutamine synthetase